MVVGVGLRLKVGAVLEVRVLLMTHLERRHVLADRRPPATTGHVATVHLLVRLPDAALREVSKWRVSECVSG